MLCKGIQSAQLSPFFFCFSESEGAAICLFVTDHINQPFKSVDVLSEDLKHYVFVVIAGFGDQIEGRSID